MEYELRYTPEEIDHRRKLLANAEIVLKKELVGIDDIIENVLKNLRPWYLYPELIERPLVMTVVGLTGVGKTQIIRRLASLLELEDDFVYFNFAEIGEMSSWQVEDTITNSLVNNKPNRMFVYDEFQYAATLDGMGGEKDNKSGLKPFWELLDTGKFHRRTSIYTLGTLKNVIRYLDMIGCRMNIDIQKGRWVNAEECVDIFSDYELLRFRDLLNIPHSKTEQEHPDHAIEQQLSGKNDVKKSTGIAEVSSDAPRPVVPHEESSCSFIFTDKSFERIHDLYSDCYGWTDKIDLHKAFESMNSIEDVMKLLEKLDMDASKGYDADYSKSVIFVIANIDEAYNMTFNLDPDMSPDMFHEQTKKLTIVDIKKALQRRFRNEQISRLGNLYFIYPSFSSKTFNGIIDLQLRKYQESVNKRFNIWPEFDDSIKDIIYTESVFPTHGTRPVMSSVYEIVQTKLPYVIDKFYEKHKKEEEITFLCYSYKDEKVTVKAYTGPVSDEPAMIMNFDQPLRLDREKISDNGDKQAMIATHESGHFVVYAKLFDMLPEKLVSRVASTDTGGFMIPDLKDNRKFMSREEMENELCVDLAGYVAEMTVFGQNNMSGGACQDLINATCLASNMIRNLGFGSNQGIVSTYLMNPDSTRGGMIMKEQSDDLINSEIKGLINSAIRKVQNIFAMPDWKRMLKKSAQYLTEHSVMPREVMQELYDEVDMKYKTPKDEHKYANLLEKF